MKNTESKTPESKNTKLKEDDMINKQKSENKMSKKDNFKVEKNDSIIISMNGITE